MQMATPEGLEPPTSALGKPCSIRLSYGATRALTSGSRPQAEDATAATPPFSPKPFRLRDAKPTNNVPPLWLKAVKIQHPVGNKA